MSQTPHRSIARFRVLRAYRVTFQVLFRYFFLFVIKKFVTPAMGNRLTSRTHQKASQDIINNILKLKGIYIKIGQTLSIMTNFLPKEFTEGLERLQDDVPPHPYAAVEARFIAEFGKKPEEIFDTFDQTPIASASLAQVHAARLKDGTKLAIKLQYPDIDVLVKKDLKTIKRIFGIIDLVLPGYGFTTIYRESSKMVTEELDFIREGKNLERITANFKGQNNFHFPKIHWDYCTSKIMAVEFIEGIKISNLEALKSAGINPHDLAVSLIHAYCKQIFIDGVYHADPHPGNILVIPKPSLAHSPSSPTGEGQKEENFQIALLDFGATGEVTQEIRNGMLLFVEGLIKKDTRTLSAGMKQMGFIVREEGEESFDKIVEYFYSKIKAIKIEDFREIKIANFQHLDDILELKKMDVSFRDLTKAFHVPKDWVLLERALILTFGLVTHLDPQLNPVDIVLPYVEKFVLGKDKTITDMILVGTKELLISYINLPSEITKTIRKLEEGKIFVTDKSRQEQTEKTTRAVRQICLTLLVIASGTFSYLLQKDGNDAMSTELKYVCYGLSGILGLSFLRSRK